MLFFSVVALQRTARREAKKRHIYNSEHLMDDSAALLAILNLNTDRNTQEGAVNIRRLRTLLNFYLLAPEEQLSGESLKRIHRVFEDIACTAEIRYTKNEPAEPQYEGTSSYRWNIRFETITFHARLLSLLRCVEAHGSHPENGEIEILREKILRMIWHQERDVRRQLDASLSKEWSSAKRIRELENTLDDAGIGTPRQITEKTLPILKKRIGETFFFWNERGSGSHESVSFDDDIDRLLHALEFSRVWQVCSLPYHPAEALGITKNRKKKDIILRIRKVLQKFELSLGMEGLSTITSE